MIWKLSENSGIQNIVSREMFYDSGDNDKPKTSYQISLPGSNILMKDYIQISTSNHSLEMNDSLGFELRKKNEGATPYFNLNNLSLICGGGFQFTNQTTKVTSFATQVNYTSWDNSMLVDAGLVKWAIENNSYDISQHVDGTTIVYDDDSGKISAVSGSVTREEYVPASLTKSATTSTILHTLEGPPVYGGNPSVVTSGVYTTVNTTATNEILMNKTALQYNATDVISTTMQLQNVDSPQYNIKLHPDNQWVDYQLSPDRIISSVYAYENNPNFQVKCQMCQMTQYKTTEDGGSSNQFYVELTDKVAKYTNKFTMDKDTVTLKTKN
jgi:hypothetical protein